MPKPLGNPVVMSAFIVANHAGNVVTRRSHSGIFIFVNNAMITSFSKRQNTVEGSTFGLELVCGRITCDMIVALRIKLKMFCIPMLGPTNVFCDNMGI